MALGALSMLSCTSSFQAARPVISLNGLSSFTLGSKKSQNGASEISMTVRGQTDFTYNASDFTDGNYLVEISTQGVTSCTLYYRNQNGMEGSFSVPVNVNLSGKSGLIGYYRLDCATNAGPLSTTLTIRAPGQAGQVRCVLKESKSFVFEEGKATLLAAWAVGDQVSCARACESHNTRGAVCGYGKADWPGNPDCFLVKYDDPSSLHFYDRPGAFAGECQ